MRVFYTHIYLQGSQTYKVIYIIYNKFYTHIYLQGSQTVIDNETTK